LVEDVAVSFFNRNLRNLIDIGEKVGKGLVNRSRLNVFIEVTSNDDIGERILSQDLLDE